MDGDRSVCEVAMQLGGWMSSTKAEIYACIAALAALPLNQQVQVHTDSQGLISGYKSFVTEAHLQPFRRLLRNRFYHEWGILRQVVACRTAPTTLVKVSTHTGNLGNEIADHVAKYGAVSGIEWAMSFHALSSVRFHPVHRGCMPIEGDLYTYLKLQSRLWVSVTWRYRERVQEFIPFFDSVNWDLTILNVHNGNLPGSLVTSVSMCADRAYRVKVLHGMLPTAKRLMLTHPDLYHDDLCP